MTRSRGHLKKMTVRASLETIRRAGLALRMAEARNLISRISLLERTEMLEDIKRDLESRSCVLHMWVQQPSC
jgi:hypothetical protein